MLLPPNSSPASGSGIQKRLKQLARGASKRYAGAESVAPASSVWAEIRILSGGSGEFGLQTDRQPERGFTERVEQLTRGGSNK